MGFRRLGSFLALAMAVLWVLPPLQTAAAEPSRPKVVQVSASQCRSLFLLEDGTLWECGTYHYNGWSRLEFVYTPVLILEDVVQASTGPDHGMAVKSDGTLWAWGDQQYGRLGNGVHSDEYQHEPIQVMEGVRRVYASGGATYVIKEDGSLWAFGSRSTGGLEYLDIIDMDSPGGQQEPICLMEDAVHVAIGYTWHSMVLDSGGGLWGWGHNRNGPLGEWVIPPGRGEYLTAPTKLMDGVQDVAAGYWYTLVVLEDGSLWSWGEDSYGALLAQSEERYHGPVKLADGVKRVVSSSHTNAAIKEDGSLWTWGFNNCGQTGQGFVQEKGEVPPAKILENVREVALGYAHGIALKVDGTVWVWGGSNTGELGTGDRENHLEPVQIFIEPTDTDNPGTGR